MLNDGKKQAVAIAGVLAVILCGLRFWLVGLSAGQKASASLTVWDWLIVGITVLCGVLIVLPLLIGKVRTNGIEPQNNWGFPLALISLFAGAVLVVTNLLDIWSWWVNGQIPASQSSTLQSIDQIAFIGVIVFGILGGCTLIYLGFRWTMDRRCTFGVARAAMLSPVMWMAMLLVRYEVSYASTVSIKNKYFDFMFLIVLTLFLYHFARMVSGMDQGNRRALLFFSLATGMLTIAGLGTPLLFLATGNADGYAATCDLLSLTNASFGLLAIAVGLSVAFSHPITAAAKEPEPELTKLTDPILASDEEPVIEAFPDFATRMDQAAEEEDTLPPDQP